MKFSEIKEVYSMVKEDTLYPNWTLKQNVNDFIEFIETIEIITRTWNRNDRNEFEYCFKELYAEYKETEDMYHESQKEEIEIILPWEMQENSMIKNEYLKSVAL